MQLSDFDFDLPVDLIAQYPAPERRESRLFCLNPDTGAVQHRQFTDLLEFLSPGDLLVMNDSRVFPARLYGKKSTGGKIEMLVERIVDDSTVLAHIKSSKAPKVGATLEFSHVRGTVVERCDALFKVQFDLAMPVLQWLESVGEIPLPGYIDRAAELQDKIRYQTVYAKSHGSVAAPTAGLHFDTAFLEQLQKKGVGLAYVTLHVGAGTFQPVRAEQIEKHQLHSEILTVSQQVCDAVKKAKAQSGRVIAVGTTAIRSLETAAKDGVLKPYQGETQLFIYPGYQFNCIDAMVTNFHFPKSSLLMLVSAFAGYETVMSAYKEAVEKKYRFFSYGDAMFIAGKMDGIDNEV